MVDYLESLERLAMPDELHIKECEKLGIGVTEDFDIVEQALLELKAIKEANPSEAWKIVYNNFDYLISDVGIENDDVNICLKTIKEQLPTIKHALHRLESIDNANPSEALECLEKVYSRLPQWDLSRNVDQCNTIKQALLKAQEPKQYLKWEDLKFTYDEQKIKVKLNGENYTVVYFISPASYGHNGYEYVGILKDDNIVVYSINGYLYTATLLKQFFNNLHLEVIDNE